MSFGKDVDLHFSSLLKEVGSRGTNGLGEVLEPKSKDSIWQLICTDATLTYCAECKRELSVEYT